MRRWIVLIVYAFVAAVSQMLWLNFAPVLSLVEATYSVSELVASALILVFPLLYVILSIPAGVLIDRHGYKKMISLGAVVQAAGAALRIASGSFIAVLVGQIVVAAVQPLIVNGITKLVADWFDDQHGAAANGVGTIGMFLGMAGAMAATPVTIVAFGFSGSMILFAAIAAAAALLFVFVASERNPGVPVTTREPIFKGLFTRDLVLLYLVSFMGLGFFNGLTTWIEPIVAPNGIDSVGAGALGGVMIVAGIVGAGVIPAISDKLKRRKPFVMVCAAVALGALWPLCTSRSFSLVLVLGGVLGFFFLPAYALLLEMCSRRAGAAAAGRATGILMLMGNAGAVVVSVAMPLVKGSAPTYAAAVILMMVTVGLAVGLTAFVAEETATG